MANQIPQNADDSDSVGSMDSAEVLANMQGRQTSELQKRFKCKRDLYRYMSLNLVSILDS